VTTRRILQTPLAPLARREAQCVGLEDRLAELVRAALEPMLTEHLDRLETRLAERHQPVLPPALMTLDDVAAHLRVVPRTVQRMVARGELPAPVQIGPNCVRWRRADLDALTEAP